MEFMTTLGGFGAGEEMGFFEFVWSYAKFWLLAYGGFCFAQHICGEKK